MAMGAAEGGACPPALTVNTFIDTTTDASCTATCSLRSAIALASGCSALAVFVPAGTYAVTSSLLVTGSVRLVGEGAAQTIVDAGQTARVFSVSGNLALSGVTLMHGQVSGSGGGMSLASGGALTASDVIFANNRATLDGGGLAIASGATASCTHCMLSGNTAAGDGGGVTVAGTLTWNDSQILSNTATGVGGGVAASGSVTLARAWVSQNTASGGGGISSAGQLTVQSSTISTNRATSGDGGGIAQTASSLTLQNVSVSGNIASAAGGGIHVLALSADDWRGCTVTANQAASGGGIALASTAGLSLASTIVTGNTAPTGADCTAAPALTSGGNNLISASAQCLITSVANDVSGDAKLLSLADNGGEVPTHALAAGSVALDSGAAGLESDARGVPRPQGVAPDIGAFERGPAVLSLSGVSTPSTAPSGSTALHTYRVSNLGPTPAVQVTATATGAVMLATSTTGSCSGDVCALGAIGTGQSATVTLLVSGPLASTLTAHADNASDVTLPLTTALTPSADLALSALPASSTAVLGTQTEVVIAVHNAGPSDAHLVVLTVTPGNETFLVPAPVLPTTCVIASGGATCALGTLAAFATQTLNVAVSASALGQLTFHASVVSDVADASALDNGVDVSIAVTGVNAQSAAPTSSATGVANTGTSAGKSGCAATASSSGSAPASAVGSAGWVLTLAVWWRRPRRSSSRH